MTPLKGQTLDYSNRAGDSTCPIRPGVVFRLKTGIRRRNKYMKALVEHTVYIWIQKVTKIRDEEGRQPKDRYYFTVFVYVPRLAGAFDNILVYRKKNRFGSIAKVLHDNGYEVIGEGVSYYFDDETWESFYKVTGIRIPKAKSEV